MGVNLCVAVTDGDWFDFLRRKPDLKEVNFWKPSGKRFRALEPGELFLFKLKAHRGDRIVGGGVFTHESTMPCSLAWDAFGEANGADSMLRLRELIAQNRPPGVPTSINSDIGCRILTTPFFFDEEDWIPAPNWARSIVGVKRYSTDDADGRGLWYAVHDRLARTRAPLLDEEAVRFGAPQLIRPRLGQGAFRALVTDVYGRRCAVTQERTLPVLEAAHIRPYSEGGAHDERNGLLLRRDVHTLFDRGYVTVTPEHEFVASRRIEEDFGNGRHYRDMQGKIRVPGAVLQQPDPELLSWHNENCFLG